MYQAGASGLFSAVSVTGWGHFLDATASRAYVQVGDDHAPGRWYERAQLTALPRIDSLGPVTTAGIADKGLSAPLTTS